MKQRDLFAVFAILTAMAAALVPNLVRAAGEPPAKSDTGELVANGGAEAGKDGTPEKWEQAVFPASMQVAGVDYIWHASTAHSGKHSLCFKKTANRFFPVAQWSQRIERTGDAKNLVVSVWIKSQDAGKATLTVQFNNDDGGQIGRSFAAYIGAQKAGDLPVTQDWKKYTATIPIPDGAKEFVIAPEMYGPGVAWFDDISAHYAP